VTLASGALQIGLLLLLYYIRDGFLRVKWPNQQCQNIKGSRSPKDRLQSHQVHLTMLQYYTWMQYTVTQKIHTYTKMNLSTVKWAQWDKTQSRELLSMFICVCIALYIIVAHNIAQNRPDNFPSYPQTITIVPMMSIWGKGVSPPCTIQGCRHTNCNNRKSANVKYAILSENITSSTKPETHNVLAIALSLDEDRTTAT